MTAPALTIRDDDYLYRAIAYMRRLGLRHMPVADLNGQPVGMLDLHDALAAASAPMLDQIDRLTHADSLDGLARVKAAQAELAEDLFADNVPASEIQSLLTDINIGIHRRIIEAALHNMEEQGLGKPPVGFAFIVMGSGGRGENFLYPDQDNGFILEDYPDEAHDRVDPWFIELAERVVRDLDAVGLPLCRGYVMANNPLWRKSLSQWRQQLAGWRRKRNVVVIRHADIFFDFRPVCGALDLAIQLREHVTDFVGHHPAFLQDMYRGDEAHGVALGLFGRLVTERENKDHLGKVNLKHTGTLPLVESMRLLALREGVAETGTLGRLTALHRQGVFDDDSYNELAAAFHLITSLLLRQQIRDFHAGREVSNYAHPASLNRRERADLVEAFQTIRRLHDRLRAEFTGEIL